ncbi:DUF2279 domain-containing protein [Terrimonas pollutisoli]|uniref:DUF2279 domain-containing protein n=1 Tax=Terrimonas pollutisoli TaxID=3034147 RepID=UPI0023EC10D2|nr:DUF2279 domain-containing protein [Terrimonas sp. H1YJ31]
MKPAPVLNSSSVATLLSSSWKKLCLFLLFVCSFIFLAAQDTTTTNIGTVVTQQLVSPAAEKVDQVPNKKRVLLIAGINVAGYGGSLIALNSAWYKGYAKTSFHSFDDSREWLQVDKAGHAWGAYNASRGTTAMWDWAGFPHKKSVWIGGLSSMAYLTTIEFMDAYSAKWGWSWSDIGANIFGSGLFMGQEFLWNEQRIQYKFSFHHKDYGEQQLEQRADDLFGKPWYERMLKDYNAQTYWLSFNLRSFLKNSNLPAWLNISFGYGADGMLGGFENKWTDDADNEISRTDIPRKRQFYLAPDIDFTKIKTKSRFLKTTFAVLNSFKCPAPALMLDSKGKLKAYAIYF